MVDIDTDPLGGVIGFGDQRVDTVLLPVLEQIPIGERPGPSVFMVRAGLSVNGSELDAAEQLAARLRLPRQAMWGMAPFGGDPHQRAWTTSTTAPLLAPGQQCDPIQAAYRLSFEVPAVNRVAVGASRAMQLRALLAATKLQVDAERIAHYRRLLRGRELTA